MSLKLRYHRLFGSVFLLVCAAFLPSGASAAPQTQAGPYRVEISVDPSPIVVGSATVLVRLTDASAKPVDGATVSALVKMPTMEMGETVRQAKPVAGKPGVYEAPAAFAMAGDYEAIITINGPNGEATSRIPLRTGQDTGGLSGTIGAKTGPSPVRFLPWLLLLAGVAFVIYRMRRTGQRLRWESVLHWQFLVTVVVLIALFLLASYAVQRYRRPGSMTPLEAQGMEMNTPAPPGTAPVELATVTEGPIVATVTYTGQAVGYVEQEVNPRVRGWIIWMPLYVGDRVTKGQIVARLDTSEIQPQIAEKQAMSRMAEQGISVAQTEYRQATEQVSQARAEVAGKTAAVRDAQSAISAAEAERAQAEAELSSAQSMIANTEAELDAARAQNEYAQAQAERTRSLQRAGAASGEEAQRDTAMAADASAKVRQAQSAVLQAKAEVRAKQSAINKAGAMLKGSQAKLAQMTSDLDGARAGVRVAQAAADTARARIKQAAAGVAQARASEAQSATQKDYAEIRAEVDGVVTQRLISPGTLVNPGQTVLKVAQISPIRLQANVPDTDLEKVRVGTLVSIINKAGTGSALNARITSVAPGVDAASRMGVVEAVVPNTDRRFLPGQYVAMSISTGRQSTALKVPSSAIQWRTKASGSTLSTVSTPSVWVAEPADKGQFTVQSVGVKVGLSGGGFTEITSGLTAGQKVVTIGANTLNDGDTVVPSGTAPVTTPASDSMPGMKM